MRAVPLLSKRNVCVPYPIEFVIFSSSFLHVSVFAGQSRSTVSGTLGVSSFDGRVHVSCPRAEHSWSCRRTRRDGLQRKIVQKPGANTVAAIKSDDAESF